MKRILLIMAIALLAGLAAYYFSFGIKVKPARQLSRADNPQLAWLVTEFSLSPEQTRRVEKLQLAYEPHCLAMCEKISGNQEKISRLISQNRSVPPETEPLLQESAALQMECRKDMLGYIYAVAAEMPPKQADRYIGLMKMQVLEPGISHIPTARPRGHE